MLRGGGLLLTSLLLLTGSLSSSLGGGGLSAVVLAHGLNNRGLVLGLDNRDGVRERFLRAGLALGVAAAHNLDLNTEHTLAEKDVTGGAVDEVLGRLAGVDHEAVGELHALGAGGAQLAGNDDLATLGTALHDKTEDTIASTADGETVQQLVPERLALGDGRETAVLDLGGVEGDRVLGELETFLNEAGELANAATLLAQNLLGVCCADDDVGDGRGDSDFDAGVALLSEFSLEELI